MAHHVITGLCLLIAGWTITLFCAYFTGRSRGRDERQADIDDAVEHGKYLGRFTHLVKEPGEPEDHDVFK